MIRVYVFGKYSADNVLDVLKNIGRGQQVCARLFSLGFAPFCPWHDKSFITDRPDEDFTVKQFYEYSIAWLEVSHCLYGLHGWQESTGSLGEVKRANELKLPIFYNEADLIEWARWQK